MQKIIVMILILFSIPLFGNTLLSGKVLGDKGCASSDLYQLFVENQEKKGEYMYQVALPENGVVDFWVKPGKYKIEAISKEGCFGEKDFTIIKDDKDKKFVLFLKNIE